MKHYTKNMLAVVDVDDVDNVVEDAVDNGVDVDDGVFVEGDDDNGVDDVDVVDNGDAVFFYYV